jgi:hypothetical protein
VSQQELGRWYNHIPGFFSGPEASLLTSPSPSPPSHIGYLETPILVTEIPGEVEMNLAVDEIAKFVDSYLHNICHLTGVL